MTKRTTPPHQKKKPRQFHPVKVTGAGKWEKRSRKPSSTHQLLLRLIFVFKSTAKIKLCYLINKWHTQRRDAQIFPLFLLPIYTYRTLAQTKQRKTCHFGLRIELMLLYTPVHMMCVWAHVCMHMCPPVYIPLSICYRLGINYSTVQHNYVSRTSADPHCQRNLSFSTKNYMHHHQHHPSAWPTTRSRSTTPSPHRPPNPSYAIGMAWTLLSLTVGWVEQN